MSYIHSHLNERAEATIRTLKNKAQPMSERDMQRLVGAYDRLLHHNAC